ncbi:MAG: hypothetical protein ACKPKO_34920, partial [Candidatus Fonsibacter sp.]
LDGLCDASGYAALISTLDREMARLASEGMDEGYRWSLVVGPFIWTSLAGSSNARVTAVIRLWRLGAVRHRFQDSLDRWDVRSPLQFLGWLREFTQGDSGTCWA